MSMVVTGFQQPLLPLPFERSGVFGGQREHIGRVRGHERLELACGHRPFVMGYAKTLEHPKPSSDFPQFRIIPSNRFDCSRRRNRVFCFSTGGVQAQILRNGSASFFLASGGQRQKPCATTV